LLKALSKQERSGTKGTRTRALEKRNAGRGVKREAGPCFRKHCIASLEDSEERRGEKNSNAATDKVSTKCLPMGLQSFKKKKT